MHTCHRKEGAAICAQNLEKVRGGGGQKEEFPKAKNITFLTLDKKEHRVKTIA